MAQQLLPDLQCRFFYNNSNRPLAGGLVYAYVSGSTVLAPTYQTNQGSLNDNPLELDINGECQIWLDDSIVYDFVVTAPLSEGGYEVLTREKVSANGSGGSGTGLEFVTTSNTSSVSFFGNGKAMEPLTADVNISSLSLNAISITTSGITSGLYAVDYATNIQDLGTAIATLSINKLDKVNPSPQSVVSDVTWNGVQTFANVPTDTPVYSLGRNASNQLIKFTDSFIGLAIADTNTINLSGNGTSGSPLSADVVLNPNPSNILSTSGAGLLANVHWGDISGSLSSQTDLNNALAGKQPLDGDLTAISAMSTTGYVKRTATDTWSAVSAIPYSDISGTPTIPTNYVTTDTTQTGLTGDKTWEGKHSFNNTQTINATSNYPLRIKASSSSINTTSRFESDGWQGFSGQRVASHYRWGFSSSPFGQNNFSLTLYSLTGNTASNVFNATYGSYLDVAMNTKIPRLIAGGVTDDLSTSIQGSNGKFVGSLGAIALGESPSSSSLTGNSIKYTRDGANYLIYGIGGSGGSLRIGAESTLTNVLFTRDLKSQFFGSVMVGDIPTGTQVGLVAYDATGNLIQGGTLPTSANYVDTTTTQTGLAGDKSWTGAHSFGGGVDITGALASGLNIKLPTGGFIGNGINPVNGTRFEFGNNFKITDSFGGNIVSSSASFTYEVNSATGQHLFKDNTYTLGQISRALTSFNSVSYQFANVPTGTPSFAYGQDASGNLTKFTPPAVSSSWTTATEPTNISAIAGHLAMRYRDAGNTNTKIEGSWAYDGGYFLTVGASVVLFTLPIGLRPSAKIRASVTVSYNGSYQSLTGVWIEIDTAGVTTMYNGSASAIDTNYIFSLDTSFSRS